MTGLSRSIFSQWPTLHTGAIIEESSTFSWFQHPEAIALFAFVCGAMFLNGPNQLRILGIVMAASFPMIHFFSLDKALTRLRPVPPELKFHLAWVFWAGATGAFIAADFSLFLQSYKVLIQLMVMIWIIYAILRNLDNVDVVLWAVLAGGIVQIAAVLLGYSEITIQNRLGTRVSGLTANPNALGFRMVWCVLSGLILWDRPMRWKRLFKVGVLALLPLAFYIILLSGSRKSTMAFIFMMIAWAGYAIGGGRELKHYLKRLVVLAVVVSAIISIMPHVLQKTTVGKRMVYFLEQGHGSLAQAAEKNKRYWMYVEGLEMFSKHPVWGVGLNNFQVYSFYRLYSHSDYMEPLATTGLVGFVLYQAFYACLLLRCLRLLRNVNEDHTLYKLKMITIGVVTIMLIGVGAPHYLSQPVYILLVTFSCYTWKVLIQILHLKDIRDGFYNSSCKLRL